MKTRLLFIEDEADLGNVVKQYLEIMDFEVTWCTSGEEAYRTWSDGSSGYDLLIIDIKLPDINGFELAERILKTDPGMAFLFLTARNEKHDRIRGLGIGADDYIGKPFDIEELILRIKNILRRKQSGRSSLPGEEFPASEVSIGDILLKKDLLTLTIGDGKPVPITQRVAELLEYLCLHPNRILKREDILVQLWGENDYFLGRSLDVFISKLRKLLRSSRHVRIENVYGVGFIFSVTES